MEKTLYAPALGTHSGLHGVFGSLRARIEQYKTYRSTIRELSSLSDRSLADLGLSRGMIEDLARESAYGK